MPPACPIRGVPARQSRSLTVKPARSRRSPKRQAAGEQRSRVPKLIVRARKLRQTEGARAWLGFRSGDGPLSGRARPSRLKHDRGRRTTSTGGKCLANVHAKSCLIPEPLRTLRPETKGQAEPARTGRGPSPARFRRSLRLPLTATAPANGKHQRSTVPRDTCTFAWQLGICPA